MRDHGCRAHGTREGYFVWSHAIGVRMQKRSECTYAACDEWDTRLYAQPVTSHGGYEQRSGAILRMFTHGIILSPRASNLIAIYAVLNRTDKEERRKSRD